MVVNDIIQSFPQFYASSLGLFFFKAVTFFKHFITKTR